MSEQRGPREDANPGDPAGYSISSDPDWHVDLDVGEGLWSNSNRLVVGDRSRPVRRAVWQSAIGNLWNLVVQGGIALVIVMAVLSAVAWVFLVLFAVMGGR